MGSGVEGRGSVPGRRCDACGAAVIREADSYCVYCGAELPLPKAGPMGDTAARFAALEVHPRTKALRERGLERRGPGRPRAVGGGNAAGMVAGLCLVAALVVLGLAGLAMAHESWGVRGLVVAVVSAGAVAVTAALVVSTPVETPGLRTPGTPTWLPVRILGVQVDEVGAGQYRRIVHKVLVEERDGARRQLDVPSPRLREHLATDDMGLAQVEGDELAVFERVDV